MAYLLFCGDDYYPCGGAYDLAGRFDSVDMAVAAHEPSKFGINGGWANVLCLDSLKVVKRFHRGVWSDVENKDG